MKCRSCRFVFSKRIPSSAELDQYYSGYGLSQYLSPLTVRRYNEWLDRFEAYRKHNRILDAGCGNGLFLSEAKKRGWEVYGSEYGKAQVAICEAKGITMHQGGLSEDVFTGLEFDVVVSIEVIEHVATPLRDMQILSGLLRKGGLLYCTTPNFNALSRFILRDKYNIISYPEHLSYFTPRTLKALARRSGLEVLEIKTTGISVTRFNQSTGKREQQVVSSTSDDELLRVKMESSWYLLVIKKFVNFLFNLSGTGYSLKGSFRKS